MCLCFVLGSFKLDGDTQGWLEIDSATGEIKTKDKLDRETLETFEVTITAFEKGEIIQRHISQLFPIFLSKGQTVSIIHHLYLVEIQK